MKLFCGGKQLKLGTIERTTVFEDGWTRQEKAAGRGIIFWTCDKVGCNFT